MIHRQVILSLSLHWHVTVMISSKNVLNEIETALTKNGLIKIRFEADRSVIQKCSTKIQEKLGCECIGKVGKVSVFFRDMPESA